MTGAKTEAHKLALKGLQLAMKANGLKPEEFEVDFNDESVSHPGGRYFLTTAQIKSLKTYRTIESMPSLWQAGMGDYFVIINELKAKQIKP
jgi:hypothetical protein